MERPTLIRSRSKPIALLALIALLVAQSAAGLHVLKHLGTPGESTGLPGQHMQLCLECASFAPLAGAHGGAGASAVVAFVAADGAILLVDHAAARVRAALPFQSRAPPR